MSGDTKELSLLGETVSDTIVANDRMWGGPSVDMAFAHAGIDQISDEGCGDGSTDFYQSDVFSCRLKGKHDWVSELD